MGLVYFILNIFLDLIHSAIWIVNGFTWYFFHDSMVFFLFIGHSWLSQEFRNQMNFLLNFFLILLNDNHRLQHELIHNVNFCLIIFHEVFQIILKLFIRKGILWSHFKVDSLNAKSFESVSIISDHIQSFKVTNNLSFFFLTVVTFYIKVIFKWLPEVLYLDDSIWNVWHHSETRFINFKDIELSFEYV